jgi:mono/diheme cytochrome c family protein
MNKSLPTLLTVALAAGSCSIVMACSGQTTASSSSTPTSSPSLRSAPAYSAIANGRAIFQTGLDVDGVQIVAEPQAMFSSCEACHRADGSGGRKFADGAVSADLRHRALVNEQKHPYTLALLERAISTGVDNEGQKLDRVMPRWQLSRRDLHDVAQYVLVGLK